MRYRVLLGQELSYLFISAVLGTFLTDFFSEIGLKMKEILYLCFKIATKLTF